MSNLIPRLLKGNYLKKLRVGPSEDGGYVVEDEVSLLSDVLISAGVGEDVRFETEFYARYQCKGILIDPFVSEAVASESKADLVFRSKVAAQHMVSGPDAISLDELVAKASFISGLESPRMTLKMDIEWDEWSVLEQADPEVLAKFDQILIEFHFVPVVPSLGLPLSPYFQSFQFMTANKINFELKERYGRVIEKLQTDFSCIHLHANNSLGVHSQFGETVPFLLEATFVKSALINIGGSGTTGQSTVEINASLDSPNKANRPDISGLSFQGSHD